METMKFQNEITNDVKRNLHYFMLTIAHKLDNTINVSDTATQNKLNELFDNELNSISKQIIYDVIAGINNLNNKFKLTF
jgi:hypothetical protein